MGKKKLEQDEANPEDWSGVIILNGKQHLRGYWKEIRELMMSIAGGRAFQQKEPELVQRPWGEIRPGVTK